MKLLGDRVGQEEAYSSTWVILVIKVPMGRCHGNGHHRGVRDLGNSCLMLLERVGGGRRPRR